MDSKSIKELNYYDVRKNLNSIQLAIYGLLANDKKAIDRKGNVDLKYISRKLKQKFSYNKEIIINIEIIKHSIDGLIKEGILYQDNN